MDTNPVPPRGRKLRASCDGCYLAKLKCTKERPTCPRCRNLGIVCHYSPSMRMGKPRQNQGQKQPPAATATMQQPSAPPSASQSPQPSHSSTWPINGPNAQSISSGSAHNRPGPTQTASLSSIESTFSIPNSYPSTVATSPVNFEDDFSTWNESSMFKLGDGFMTFPHTTPNSEHQLLSSSATNTIFAPPSPLGSRCGCYRSIVEALHAMQATSTNSQYSALDTVLNDCKDMVQKGEAMLNCSCSEDSTLIMLLAGLIAKHLSFFEPGNGTCPPSPNLSPTSPSSSASGCTSLSTSLTSNNGGTWFPPTPQQPSPTRITIGKYTMDGEDEERLRLEIILMELQRLNSLLAKFYGKFSSLPAGSDRQTYETLVNYLSQKLSDATKRLERRKQRMRSDGFGTDGIMARS